MSEFVADILQEIEGFSNMHQNIFSRLKALTRHCTTLCNIEHYQQESAGHPN